MIPVAIAIATAVTSLIVGWVSLLSPLFRLHSRLDVTDYRITEMEKELKEMQFDLKELLRQSTRQQKT